VDETETDADSRDPLSLWGSGVVGEGEEVPADLSKGGLDRRYVECMCPALDAATGELWTAIERARGEAALVASVAGDKAAAAAAAPPRRVQAGGVIEDKHSTDTQSPPPPPFIPRECSGIHR